MARFELNADDLDALQTQMMEYGEGAGQKIDEVLHGEGAREIDQKIMQLLPESGRHWKGKKAAARSAQPFTQEDGTLSVTIKTVSNYHYLYFPDDGSNTRKHAGNKQFMRAGTENASGKIIDLCIGKLTEGF